MKICLFILLIFFLFSCKDPIESNRNITSKDSLILSILGTWKGYKNEPIWDIRPDSIFYYSENKSYYYFIHNNDMIVMYKKGPFSFKNFRVINDTFFFKTGDLDAAAIKSKNTNPIKLSKNHLDNDAFDEKMNEIIGEWGYEYTGGIFKWIFTKDSIYYFQSNKRHFYKQHENDIIILTEKEPMIMRDIIVRSDTISFTTEDNVFIKAHKIKGNAVQPL